ncbi:hypothetical protein [Nitrosomonas ureae]|uniref:hypothetical protein n=1 Tax=Nitrosomonas ureae TaxID=44577 RepID=UPI0015E8C09E|nr:hypothetical protein [Nitrosomonas ureae]
MIAAKAKERKLSTLKQFTDVADLPQREAGKTRDELATMSGVSGSKEYETRGSRGVIV